MRKRAFTMILGVIFVVEITVLVFVLRQDTDAAQDAVLVNEAVQSVQRGWDGTRRVSVMQCWIERGAFFLRQIPE